MQEHFSTCPCLLRSTNYGLPRIEKNSSSDSSLSVKAVPRGCPCLRIFPSLVQVYYFPESPRRGYTFYAHLDGLTLTFVTLVRNLIAENPATKHSAEEVQPRNTMTAFSTSSKRWRSLRGIKVLVKSLEYCHSIHCY